MTTLLQPKPAALRSNTSRPQRGRSHTLACPGSPAEEDLVREYLPLVRTVVGRLAMTLPTHIDPDDLYSSGLVGLLNAIRNFDPEGGSSFESYARVRIRGAVFDELRRLDWVPRSVHDKARKVEAVMQRLEQHHGEIPTAGQVAEALGLTSDEYDELLDEIRPATFLCLDAPALDEPNDGSRYESIADESQRDPVDCTAHREMVRMVTERIRQLPAIQRKVLALYYFEDLRLREIAEAFGVTESRICQIHAQAILAIRSFLVRDGVGLTS
jgi:RNA polymerase sigma factor FliA